jgi:hypothetical protein
MVSDRLSDATRKRALRRAFVRFVVTGKGLLKDLGALRVEPL